MAIHMINKLNTKHEVNNIMIKNAYYFDPIVVFYLSLNISHIETKYKTNRQMRDMIDWTKESITI